MLSLTIPKKRVVCILLGTAFAQLFLTPAWGQQLTAQKNAALTGRDYTESRSYNEAKRGSERSLQYIPQGRDFVCVNGKNRFTRALYGTHTAYRLETSDRPVFAVYHKPKYYHIAFGLGEKGHETALDSTTWCEARYTPGKRSYLLTDAAWKEARLAVEVWALADREGAVWRFSLNDVHRGNNFNLKTLIGPIKAKRLSRNGDMGADPADCFEASTVMPPVRADIPLSKGTVYLVYENGTLRQVSHSEGKKLVEQAEAYRCALASTLEIDTPDPYLNTLGGALAVAADGIWDGEVWLHGAIGWRMPLSGWRAAYTGDFLGWHDRGRTHFDNYAASQVTDVPPVYPHPTQDSTMNLARAEKKWGTQMYSNGYICRNPRRNDQMHHYDMNLCYMDELVWHLCWTGDTAYARKIWPVITRHLTWEKRNFDPDNDGLYDAYCCIWASDALYYNSGAVTHSSAYNYRANKLAALIAQRIGKDPKPYAEEADRILKAMNQRLWMKDKGCWAEFQDFMGHKRLHTAPAVWTVYHAIDSETGDMFQNYLATCYVDREIPHIDVKGKGLKDGGYQTISTTNWMPYSWSINNVAFAEVMHTALAYWLAQRPDAAFHLFKSSVLDGMYLGNSPGNFGQISFYDAARGECYRDFGDPIGVASRALVQGLFGIAPDLLNNRVCITPGFPSEWQKASIRHRDIEYSYRRVGEEDVYTFTSRFKKGAKIEWNIPCRYDNIKSVTLDGKELPFKLTPAVGSCRLNVKVPTTGKQQELHIVWNGKPLHIRCEEKWNQIPSFTRCHRGKTEWWQPAVTVSGEAHKAVNYGTELPAFSRQASFRLVVIDSLRNARVTDIFRNKYLSPRSPYTSLEIPVQGIGEWCHPKETAEIDDSGLRAKVRGGVFTTPQGIPFRLPAEGQNIVFTSLWDNYPDSVQVPLQGQASGVCLLLAGSTNHMQCRIDNGSITVTYTDGDTARLPLVNPDNWAPIEQDFFMDGKAFCNDTPRPYRVVLSSGLVSNDLERDLKLHTFNERRIPGGAATLLYLPLNRTKTLKSLTLETLSNDVVIGVMGITLVDEAR